MSEVQQIDRDKLGLFVKQTGGMVAAGFNCAISLVGDRLGLFKELAANGPYDSEGLAGALGLQERWGREWLHHQACIGQVEYDAATATFAMSPEAAAVLAQPEHPAFLMGAYESAVAVFPAVEKLADAFRTGLGMSYDDHGPNCACGIEQMGAFTKQQRLVPELIPMIPGMRERLQAGAKVADVGCGGALSTIAMAQAFPNSTFIGYDTSTVALDRARANVAEAGLANIALLNPMDEPLSAQGQFDLVTTFDVVHDTPYPDRLIADIFASLSAADGYWLCEDIKGFESFSENHSQHPLAALLYGFSVTICMSSGLSTPDGAGLGTLGFTRNMAESMGLAAGFTGFQHLEVDNPMNNYYLFSKTE